MTDQYRNALGLVADGLEQSGMFRVLRQLPPLPALASEASGGNVYKGVVFDQETTGLDTSTCKVIEVSAVPFFYTANGAVLGVDERRRYSALQDPGEPLSDEIVRVTGIRDEMLRGEMLRGEIIDHAKLAACFEGANLAIAHNAAFDRKIAHRFFLESIPASLNWACSSEEIDWKSMGCPSRAMQVIAWWLGYFYDAHRATSDTQALASMLNIHLPRRSSIFSELLASARRKSWRVYADGSPFSAKDALKARGYHWDPERKVWWKDIWEKMIDIDGVQAASAVNLDVEKIWLHENAQAKPTHEEMTARTRYLQ